MKKTCRAKVVGSILFVICGLTLALSGPARPDLPIVGPIPPTARTNPPTVRTNPPTARTNPPTVRTNSPTVRTNPPTVRTNPPTVRTNPSTVRTNSPIVKINSPIVRTNPRIAKTNPSIDGTDPSIDGTDPSIDGTDPPIDGTNPPIDGTDPPIVGPMVGHVTDTEATLWAYGGAGVDFSVLVWPEGDPSGDQLLPMTADPTRYYSATVTISGLSPSTTYRYRMASSGTLAPDRGGQFRTAPIWGQPARFTMTLASCMSIADPDQSSWNLVALINPAFQLLVGDQVYPDTPDHDIIWDHHVQYRTVPEFANVIANTPTYAMWDDHDYGQDDSDGTLAGKEDSLRAFQEVWANPPAIGATVEGAFYEFQWGDVDFFILDGRYHRSPNEAPNDDQKRMLGDEQFAWFEQRLLASTATFKVIASGSTLDLSAKDGWRIYDFSRERLFRTIMENGIEGVVYLTGDAHFSLIEEHPPSRTGGYTLYEIISSGITRGEARSFAALTFDTTLPDPILRVRIVRGDAALIEDRTIYLSELRLP
jgi:alkaline phosphatase D